MKKMSWSWKLPFAIFPTLLEIAARAKRIQSKGSSPDPEYEDHITASYYEENELGVLVPSSTHSVWARVADYKDKTPQVSNVMYTCMDIANQLLPDMVESSTTSFYSQDFCSSL